MACLTIRNIDEDLKTCLRLRAAQHGRSMEAEARNILAQTLLTPVEEGSFVRRIRQRFAGISAAGDLSFPSRQEVRTPLDLSE